MKCIAKPTLILVLTLAICSPWLKAAPKPLKLPPETAKLRKSSLPGYALATQKCLVCHSADYISYQAPNMNQAQWTGEVLKMQHSYGAQFSPDEVKSIGAYLAVAYGSAKATDASIIAASRTAKTGTQADHVMDPQRLLNRHACLGCHAIDKNKVGPSFHDIANRYQNDTLGQSKLLTSIQQGSSGKWGQMPMPPITAISKAQAQSLADFILKQ